MNNPYYLIWADAILSIQKHHPNIKWKTPIFILITWVHALNFWIIILWLKYFDIFTIPLITVDLFPGKLLNSFFAFTIEFALPFGILNYFLVFYRDRYKRIIKKYPNPPVRYSYKYGTTMIFGAFISAVLYGILR
ncbi:MAG TPA: hypothetical protein VMW01_02050 [Williamwhitmania sp.]|nr:hypothetical protein [Williamwhitmania sp.]